jgi:hypothetical protein
MAAYVKDTLTSPGYDNRTFQFAHVVEAPVVAARVIVLNNLTTTPTLSKVGVAPSTVFPGTNYNPSGGGASFTSVTFGGSASVTLPARISANVPSRTVSDWITVSSLSPSDGGTLPYMFWRFYNSTGPLTGFLNTADLMSTGSGSLAANGLAVWPTTSDARSALRRAQWASQSGDFSATNFTGPQTNFSNVAVEFEYRYANGHVVTLCALGDSITQGDAASVHCLSPVHYAVNGVSTAGQPIVPCNQGYSSQTTSNFVARLQQIIASGQIPNILVYSAWSPNDIPGGNGSSVAVWNAAIDAMKANLATVLSICQSNRIFPIIATGTPYIYDATHDALRVAYNDYLRALASANLVICDYDATVTDGATPAKMQTSLADGVSGALHPYDAGYIAMGATLQTALQTALTRFAT